MFRTITTLTLSLFAFSSFANTHLGDTLAYSGTYADKKFQTTAKVVSYEKRTQKYTVQAIATFNGKEVSNEKEQIEEKEMMTHQKAKLILSYCTNAQVDGKLEKVAIGGKEYQTCKIQGTSLTQEMYNRIVDLGFDADEASIVWLGDFPIDGIAKVQGKAEGGNVVLTLDSFYWNK